MNTILKMILAKYRPKVEYAGRSANGQCYHVTLPPTATEDDVYGAKEACTAVGYTALCYHSGHNGTPQLGVFSEC